MGRSLIDTGKSRFQNRVTFVDAVAESFTVPAGVTEVYATLVAAGGRDNSAYTAPISVTSSPVAMAISDTGRHLFSSVVSGATSDLLMADPVGRKLVRKAETAAISVNYAGQQAIALDNGFFITAGSETTAAYSLNAGLSFGTIGTILAGYSTIAAAPIGKFAPTTDVRCCYVNSDTTVLSRWTGTAWSNLSAVAGKAFTSMSFANGYFIAGENNATSKTSLYYQTEALANTSGAWSTVVIDAVNNKAIYDVTYGGGQYVAVGEDGKIYTCATINGTWVARTSNTANHLYAIKYANGRFVAVGNSGATTTSTDGITWIATTVNTEVRYRKDLYWWEAQSVWVIGRGDGGYWYYSTDATSWTSGGAGATRGICVCAAGLIYATSSVLHYITTNPATAGAVFSTSKDGGNAGVARATGSIVTVAGGLVGVANNGGNGGSSTGVFMKGGTGTAKNPAQGMGGNGGITTVVQASGTGGYTNAANLYGGGGCPLLEDIIDGLEGIFIPGGGGAYWTTSALSGGGGTVLARGGTAGTNGMGYGGGQGSTSTGAGGGGESVIRYKITVTPGEVLAVSSGLASGDGTSPAPFNGYAILEW